MILEKLKSTGAVLGLSHLHPAQRVVLDAISVMRLSFFFCVFCVLDSGRFALILTETGVEMVDTAWFQPIRLDFDWNGRWNSWYSPILIETDVETSLHHVVSLHSFASCGLVEKKKGIGRRDKDDTVDRFLNGCIGSLILWFFEWVDRKCWN